MLNDLSPTDLAIIAATFVGVWHYFKGRSASVQAPAPPSPAPEAPAGDLLVRLTALEFAVQGLPSLFETKVAHVKEQIGILNRSAARLEQAERRAEERSARDAAEPELQLGPLANPFRQLNGTRGGEVAVPAVRTNVAPPDALAQMMPHKVR